MLTKIDVLFIIYDKENAVHFYVPNKHISLSQTNFTSKSAVYVYH